MKYGFIREHQREYPISTMCRVLEVAVSGFYAWLRRAPSRRSQENTGLGERIVRIYQQNRQVYGSPRIHAVLRAEGQACGKKRVARLMRERGLSAKPRRHRTRTTDSQHEQLVAPNLLNREFSATAPNTRVGGRYHGDLDDGGLALSGGRDRHLFAHGRRLGHGCASG